MSLANLTHDYNAIEPFIWYTVALLSFPAVRGRSPLRERITLFATLVVFGTSDFYETLAWWTPWWLLLWKAMCLVVLTVLIYRIRQRSKPINKSQLTGNG